MAHLQNLEQLIGGFGNKKILDIGAGSGRFMFECIERGYDATGIEIDSTKIESAQIQAHEKGIKLNLFKGIAEQLPFPDSSFDFVNVGEVIEHVRDPKQVLVEIYRVLRPGGTVYISVHNRFGMYDTHFHIYFLGWMPRSWANKYISFFGKDKDIADAIDLQNICDMHYFTFGQFKKLAKKSGLRLQDIREIKIQKRFSRILAYLTCLGYVLILRPFYFSTFHFLLYKDGIH
ncbi:class I SAM-dependent methyltransferase [Candidatus Parcubacteria bacterium]|nr:class I SAM-dependent methyltransferase [Candidatus Parcubacteria bacterium]